LHGVAQSAKLAETPSCPDAGRSGVAAFPSGRTPQRAKKGVEMYALGPSRILLLVAFVLAVVGGARAAAEVEPSTDERGRLAIVVGNSSYESERYEDLANAANDAEKLAESLKRLNFDVITGIDATAEEFEKIIADVERRLDGYAAVVIFYAGHGVQVS